MCSTGRNWATGILHCWKPILTLVFCPCFLLPLHFFPPLSEGNNNSITHLGNLVIITHLVVLDATYSRVDRLKHLIKLLVLATDITLRTLISITSSHVCPVVRPL